MKRNPGRARLRALQAAASRTRPAPRLWMLQGETGEIRRDTFQGREHIVVPVVALVEGVIQCSTCPQPELALAAEFGKVLESWDGRPVTVPHPTDAAGSPISANTPAVLEQFQVGTIFNTTLEGTSLQMEAWVDPELAANVADGPRLLELLEALEGGAEEVRIEVSTGLFPSVVPHQGRFNGQPYAGIWRDIKPDHLALLREFEEGACNWQMGCGVRANASADAAPIVSACGCGSATADLEAARAELERIRERLNAAIERNSDAGVDRIRASATGTSFEDLRRAVVIALDGAIDGELFAVHAIFQDAVVYETWSSMRLFERPWRMEGDQVELGDEIQEVRPETRFVPVDTPRANRRRENQMDREQIIASLIANAATQWEEGDREFLEGLEDARLTKLVPNETPTPDPDDEPEIPEGAVLLSALTREQLEEQAERLGVEVADRGQAPELTDQDRRLLDRARAREQARQTELVAAIRAYESNEYTDAELGDMELEELERLARFAGITLESEEADYARPIPAVGGDGGESGFAKTTPMRDQMKPREEPERQAS